MNDLIKFIKKDDKLVDKMLRDYVDKHCPSSLGFTNTLFTVCMSDKRDCINCWKLALGVSKSDL